VSDDRDGLADDAAHLLVIETTRARRATRGHHPRAPAQKRSWPTRAKTAFAWRAQHRPQGIVLDVNLPDIDGWQVMERLRNHPSTREIPVHFVSGVDSPDRGLALGAIGYLMKPASHAELALAVRALTPAAPGRRGASCGGRQRAGRRILVQLLRKRASSHARGQRTRGFGSAGEGQLRLHDLDLGLPDMDGLACWRPARARLGRRAFA